jgi:hypothetical protein
MDFIHEDAILAVKRGIYWLDENHPGWAQDINLDELDMSECTDCVIGQAVGSYSYTINKAATGDANEWDHAAATQWSVEHGFEYPGTLAYANPGYAAPSYGYRELDTLWSDEVRKRLG